MHTAWYLCIFKSMVIHTSQIIHSLGTRWHQSSVLYSRYATDTISPDNELGFGACFRYVCSLNDNRLLQASSIKPWCRLNLNVHYCNSAIEMRLIFMVAFIRGHCGNYIVWPSRSYHKVFPKKSWIWCMTTPATIRYTQGTIKSNRRLWSLCILTGLHRRQALHNNILAIVVRCWWSYSHCL